MRIRWDCDGASFCTSHNIENMARDWGFRVWDGGAPETGLGPAGGYEVSVETRDWRAFGSATLVVD